MRTAPTPTTIQYVSGFAILIAADIVLAIASSLPAALSVLVLLIWVREPPHEASAMHAAEDQPEIVV